MQCAAQCVDCSVPGRAAGHSGNDEDYFGSLKRDKEWWGIQEATSLARDWQVTRILTFSTTLKLLSGLLA